MKIRFLWAGLAAVLMTLGAPAAFAQVGGGVAVLDELHEYLQDGGRDYINESLSMADAEAEVWSPGSFLTNMSFRYEAEGEECKAFFVDSSKKNRLLEFSCMDEEGDVIRREFSTRNGEWQQFYPLANPELKMTEMIGQMLDNQQVVDTLEVTFGDVDVEEMKVNVYLYRTRIKGGYGLPEWRVVIYGNQRYVVVETDADDDTAEFSVE